MKLSLQKKIILSFLTVIIITSSFSTFVGVRLIGKSIPIVQDKVRLDLNSAREIYNEAVKEVKNIIRLSSIRFFIKDALLLNNIDSLSVELEEIRKNESLDFLTLTNPEGIVLLRAGNPEIKGDSQAYKEIINKARDGKTVVASTEIMSGEELSRERKELAIQAYTRIVSSPHTNTPGKTEETSGMVIIGAAPIFNDEENIIGILYGGRLLNHNFSIVDKIRDTIYEREKYKDRDVGVVTVFMNDIRVSTNVISTNGERAVGTLVSAEVEKNVLWEGKNWVERAFAVNEWYITAYEPVKNISGNIVGILGIGILENKYKDIEKHALLIFLGISFGGILLSIALCGFLTNSIMRPIKSLVDATRNIADGNMDQQVLLKDAPYEIEALEKAYNYMVSSIKERDEQLRQRAQEEIMKSERLAMVGQLAAGVAHEINNPLGGILLFSGLLLKKAPSEGLIRENLERIEKEAKRCQNIVQGLLDFAREREPKTEEIIVNDILEKTINIFENQPLFHNIQVVKNYQSDLPVIMADLAQIQQVFVNIIMNAADAMNGKGTLTISTKSEKQLDTIEIGFTDTGIGIPPENLDRIFEPFFTTKGVGHGTGLGLSISYGIVQGHGGTIKVSSQVGKGSAFTINLPKIKERA